MMSLFYFIYLNYFLSYLLFFCNFNLVLFYPIYSFMSHQNIPNLEVQCGSWDRAVIRQHWRHYASCLDIFSLFFFIFKTSFGAPYMMIFS